MITIKRFIVFKFVWFFLFYAPLAFSLEECNFFSLERNIEEVQSRKAKGKIQDLFRCKDESYRFTSYQWYYIDVQVNKIEKPNLVYSVKSPPKSSGDKLISEARANNYSNLYSAIRSGNEEYVANPKAILALARALFRAGEFKNSIYYYDLYFKYKNSDDLVEAERLFSYIVMRDYEEAYNVINNLKSFEVSPFLEVSILNAEKLMAEQILKTENPENETVNYLNGTVDLEGRYLSDSYQGTSMILESKYHQSLYVYGAAIQSTGATFKEALNAAYVEGGYDDYILGILRLKGGLGYYAFREGFVTYSAGVGLSLVADMAINFDYTKTPLVFYQPMEEPGMMVADNRFILNFKWADYLNLNLMLAYEDDLKARELYQFDLGYPIFQSKNRQDYLRLVLPFYYTKRLKVSPYYRSFPSELRFEAGVDYRKTLSDLFVLRLGGTGGFVNRNHFAERSLRLNMFSFNVNAKLDFRVYKENYIYARIHLDSVDAEEWEVKRQTKDTFAIGIDFNTL